jgi:hypothetical protein
MVRIQFAFQNRVWQNQIWAKPEGVRSGEVRGQDAVTDGEVSVGVGGDNSWVIVWAPFPWATGDVVDERGRHSEG